ncbi:MAG: lipopolysaccharide biosynthesis protein, partial [Flavobacterium sp.]
MFKKIVTSSTIYALGPQLPKLVGLFLLPVITPFLTEIDFGIWGTIMAYTAIFTISRDLGMTIPLLNSFYKSPTRWKWVWGQVYYFLLLYGVAFTIVQSAILYLIIPKEVPSSNIWLIIGLISIQSLIFDVPATLGARFFQISERPIPVSVIAFASGIVSVAVQFISIIYFNAGYMSWFYATFFASLVSGGTYMLLIYKNRIIPILTFRFKWMKPRLKVALPVLPHNYSSYLLNASDRVIMNFYKVSTTNIGQYNVAYMWGNYMELLGGAVGVAVGPMYYNFFTNETE